MAIMQVRNHELPHPILEARPTPRETVETAIQSLLRAPDVEVAALAQAMARSADRVTFRDVIEAVEGPISLNVCVGEHADCSLMGACGMERVWREGQRRVLELFEKTTIADVRGPRHAPAVNMRRSGAV